MQYFATPKLGARLKAAAFAALCTLGASAGATTLFSDNFQGDLSQWSWGPGYWWAGTANGGSLVADPLGSGGKALGFAHGGSGGDIFSAQSFSSSTGGVFILSYDYLGIGAGGGYVGFNNPGETWLSGDGSYGTPFHNPDTGTWQHVSFSFVSGSPITLKLEEWGGQNSTPYQALFKNLVLTDANGVTAVPEPSSAVLMLAGLAGLGALRRRKAQA